MKREFYYAPPRAIPLGLFEDRRPEPGDKLKEDTNAYTIRFHT